MAATAVSVFLVICSMGATRAKLFKKYRIKSLSIYSNGLICPFYCSRIVPFRGWLCIATMFLTELLPDTDVACRWAYDVQAVPPPETGLIVRNAFTGRIAFLSRSVRPVHYCPVKRCAVCVATASCPDYRNADLTMTEVSVLRSWSCITYCGIM